eukprot:TRINITY_DN1012_c0_g1_i5.p1 TRINITY_DN1012_c0_g1~~TRINITY_DN1012_c0_g1_i5.p1  ORF type:complete len:448 (+),score=45.98 TRINITY_DN1012_c0_g1_i5:61-1404(+)
MKFFLWLAFMIPALLLANRVVLQQAIDPEPPRDANELHGDCKALYKAMVEECRNQPVHRYFGATGWRNCDTAMSELWFDTSPSFTKEQYQWLFGTFINHTELRRGTVLTPIFWAGFSHTLGTRPVMDDMIQALPNCSGKPFLCSDIEHASSPVGQILRESRWHRECHRSKEDKQVWVRLSEAFSFRRQQVQTELGIFEAHLQQADVPEDNAGLVLGVEHITSHIAGNKIVHVLLNKEQSILNNTFLVEYELPLLAAAKSTPTLQIWTVKTDCGESLLQFIPAELRPGLSCTSLAKYSLQDKLPEVHMQKLVKLKWKLLCLEDNFIYDNDGHINHTAQIECCNTGKTSIEESKTVWLRSTDVGKTCLMMAAEFGALRAVRHLAASYPDTARSWGSSLLSGDDRESSRLTAVCLAAQEGQLETVKFLATTYPQPRTQTWQKKNVFWQHV